jgi:1-aminocyclopropane-1-carboxylate deaminase/D-cysteine desulfhydrase-like pyridoxal-dependent ACC family enzyme
MIFDNTPIEKYSVNGKTVFVKREDLAAQYPLPPLAKMRGVIKRLQKVKAEGFKVIGVFDTKVSVAGYGTGILAKEMGMQCITYFGGTKEMIANPTPNILAAKRTGDIFPVTPGRTPICYSYAKKHAEAYDFYMMPQGLACHETSDEVSKVAASTPEGLCKGSLIIIAGTATILSGVLKGLPIMPKRVVSISACISPSKQRRNVIKLMCEELAINPRIDRIRQVEFLEPIMDYYDECSFAVPFDCNRHYDAKAWQWLCENIDSLPEPILFWNIGGNYDKIFEENK